MNPSTSIARPTGESKTVWSPLRKQTSDGAKALGVAVTKKQVHADTMPRKGDTDLSDAHDRYMYLS